MINYTNKMQSSLKITVVNTLKQNDLNCENFYTVSYLAKFILEYISLQQLVYKDESNQIQMLVDIPIKEAATVQL